MTTLWLGVLRLAVRNDVTSIFSAYKISRIQIYYNEKLIIIAQKVLLYILATTELHMMKTKKDVAELGLHDTVCIPYAQVPSKW